MAEVTLTMWATHNPPSTTPRPPSVSAFVFFSHHVVGEVCRSDAVAAIARSILSFGVEVASSHLSIATLAMPSKNSGYVICEKKPESDGIGIVHPSDR